METTVDNSYSIDIEIILALVSYLGLTNKQKRTPAKIAKHVGIEEARIVEVLERYPGLFRRSHKTSDEDEHFFSLQVRHASRHLEDDDEPSSPLGADYFSSLVQYTLERKRSEEEQENLLAEIRAGQRQTRQTTLAALLASGVAAASATIAAILTALPLW